jgi:hypothetical protein
MTLQVELSVAALAVAPLQLEEPEAEAQLQREAGEVVPLRQVSAPLPAAWRVVRNR